MQSFGKLFLKAIPLSVGIIFSLLSVAFTVIVADGSGGEGSIIAVFFFGLIGYPLVIAGALSLIRDNKDS